MSKLPAALSRKRGNGEGEPRLETIPYLTETEEAQWLAERNQMALQDSCYFLNHFIIKVSVPNPNCNSRGFFKTLRGYQATLPRCQCQLHPQKRVHLDKLSEHVRLVSSRNGVTVLLLRVVLESIWEYRLSFSSNFLSVSLSQKQNRISSQSAWTTPDSKRWAFVNCLFFTNFVAFLRLNLEEIWKRWSIPRLLLLLNCNLGSSVLGILGVNSLPSNDEKKLILF